MECQNSGGLLYPVFNITGRMLTYCFDLVVQWKKHEDPFTMEQIDLYWKVWAFPRKLKLAGHENCIKILVDWLDFSFLFSFYKL